MKLMSLIAVCGMLGATITHAQDPKASGENKKPSTTGTTTTTSGNQGNKPGPNINNSDRRNDSLTGKTSGNSDGKKADKK